MGSLRKKTASPAIPAVLGAAEFRSSKLNEVHIGPGTRLRVVVKQPEEVHELQFGKLQEWLEGGARSPKERLTKARQREVLARKVDER